MSKSAIMPLKDVTDTCSCGAAGNIRYDISIYCKCTCRWLPLTGAVWRLTYKQLVVFRRSKTGLWASKIGFRVTPTLLGWNKDLDAQMLGSAILSPRISHNSQKTEHRLTLQLSLVLMSNQSQPVVTPTGGKGRDHQGYFTVCLSQRDYINI